MTLCCSALGDVFIPVGSGRWHEQGRESCCQDPEKEVAMLKLLKGIAYITLRWTPISAHCQAVNLPACSMGVSHPGRSCPLRSLQQSACLPAGAMAPSEGDAPRLPSAPPSVPRSSRCMHCPGSRPAWTWTAGSRAPWACPGRPVRHGGRPDPSMPRCRREGRAL